MIHGATLLLLKYKLPYILHDPRNGATLLLLKYKLPYILHIEKCTGLNKVLLALGRRTCAHYED